MPTICSMCGGTYRHCQSCKSADAMIRTHENPAARVVLLQALQSFAVPSTSTTDTQQQADSAAPPDPSPT